jgi:hypothetical protein
MSVTRKPVLDLDQLVDAPQVAINGTLYSLRTQGEISPLDAHRFKKLGNRLDVLIGKEDLTEQEEQELEDIPKRLCREVLNAPAEVIGALRSNQLMAVINCFIKTLSSKPEPQATESAEADQTIQAS